MRSSQNRLTILGILYLKKQTKKLVGLPWKGIHSNLFLTNYYNTEEEKEILLNVTGRETILSCYIL